MRIPAILSCLWLGIATAMAQQHEPPAPPDPIILILMIIMPGNVPDIVKRVPMQSIEQCWADAAQFVRGDAKLAGGIGLAAGCHVMDTSDKS